VRGASPPVVEFAGSSDAPHWNNPRRRPPYRRGEKSGNPSVARVRGPGRFFTGRESMGARRGVVEPTAASHPTGGHRQSAGPGVDRDRVADPKMPASLLLDALSRGRRPSALFGTPPPFANESHNVTCGDA